MRARQSDEEFEADLEAERVIEQERDDERIGGGRRRRSGVATSDDEDDLDEEQSVRVRAATAVLSADGDFDVLSVYSLDITSGSDEAQVKRATACSRS